MVGPPIKATPIVAKEKRGEKRKGGRSSREGRATLFVLGCALHVVALVNFKGLSHSLILRGFSSLSRSQGVEVPLLSIDSCLCWAVSQSPTGSAT